MYVFHEYKDKQKKTLLLKSRSFVFHHISLQLIARPIGQGPFDQRRESSLC